MSPTPPSRPPFPDQVDIEVNYYGDIVCFATADTPRKSCRRYLSKEEALYLAREAEAKAYDRCADSFRECGETAVEIFYRMKAKELRNGT